MPAIFKSVLIEAVWRAFQADKNRSAICQELNIHDNDIDAYMLAAFKKFNQPIIRYKTDKEAPTLFDVQPVKKKRRYEQQDNELPKQMFVRPPAVYSNKSYQL
jgi:hypothetical protein